jgi:hypothetical protein
MAVSSIELARRAALIGAVAVFLAAAGGAGAAAASARHAGAGAARPAWVAPTSSLLARRFFPGKAKPVSIGFRYGAKTSTLTLRFAHAVSCNCPAPPGASVSGRRAVFTVDTRTQQMLSFRVFAR